jgi:hypothetical protein
MRRLMLRLWAIGGVMLLTASFASAASAGSWKFQPTLNAPWATEGNDAMLDSPSPNAVGLCRSAEFLAANPYLPTTNIDMIVNDASNNSGVSNFGCQTAQNETSVVVNPTNPANLVAGANDYRICCDSTGLNDGTGWAYVSMNGGASWSNVLLPGLTAETGGQGIFKKFDSAGDPVLSFGPDGTVYYANIVFSRSTPASGIAVNTSRDGGLTWSQPTMVSFSGAGNFFNDKEWIAAGPDGKVVVTWTKFDQGPHGAGYLSSPVLAAFSSDGGKTWNRQGSPVSDSTRPYDQGSLPQYAPDGTLYVAYEAGDPATGYATDQMVVARSTDNGQSFTQYPLGRVYDDVNCYPTYAGRQTLTGEQFRLNSYPSFSIDPTTGRLAVVWSDDQGAGTCGTSASSWSGVTNAVTKLVTSTNGTSFSDPRVISSGDNVFPGVAANLGKIAVSYYTRAAFIPRNSHVCHLVTGNAPGAPAATSTVDVCLGYAARSSSDDYRTETALTTEASNPYVQFANGSFIGDYTQIALGSDGLAHPVWTDFRGNVNAGGKPNQDVYTQAYRP